jgi:hypothetical protein
MTEDEIRIVKALEKCRFGNRPGSIRFISDMRWKVVHDPGVLLTWKQRYFLQSLAYRYRRQVARFLPDNLVPKRAPEPQAYGLADRCEPPRDQIVEKIGPDNEFLDIPEFLRNPQGHLF